MTLSDLREAARSVDPEPIAELTLELLHIWSPPGDEARMAERMADAFTDAGARVRLDREFPSSPSVIAELGSDDGPTIQWHGHLDAIDVEHTPPERVGDTLVGRGAADMKGPDASMVTAIRLLRDHGLPGGGRGRVLVTLHGMHETGGNEPLHALIARGIHGDAVITGELGGGVELPIAGLGLTFWEIAIGRPGMAIHETMIRADTVDPVEVGRKLHAALTGLRDRLAAVPGPDPKPSLFVGKFVSGDYYNRLPIRAELAGTRRHDGTMDLAAVAAELEALVEEIRRDAGPDADISLRAVPIAESFAVDPAATIVGATRDAHRDLFGNELALTRSRVATNAVHFVTEAGIPAVGYGPDPVTNHSDHEELAVSELSRMAGGFALASAYYLEREA